MSVTMQQLRDLLDCDEPRYVDAVMLGVDAISHLNTLATGEPTLAARAVYVASFLRDARAEAIVRSAVQSREASVRAAAAGAARNLSDEAAEAVLLVSLDDEDSGVLKFALGSIGSRKTSQQVRLKVERIERAESPPHLRHLAGQVAASWRRG
jgi:hypothetical protein